jgi:hypothetical protein
VSISVLDKPDPKVVHQVKEDLKDETEYNLDVSYGHSDDDDDD